MTNSRILLIAFIALFCNSLTAQKFIGGRINFNTDSHYEKRNINDLPVIDQSVVNFSLYSTFGRFISENTAIGIDINLGVSLSNSVTAKDNGLELGAGPFIRQYLIKMNKASFLVQGTAAYGFSNSKITVNESLYDKPKSYFVYFEVYPGLEYDVNDHIILLTTLDLFGLSYHYTHSRNTSGTVRESKFGFGGGLDSILQLGQITIGALYKF